jgi:hypothetical protein
MAHVWSATAEPPVNLSALTQMSLQDVGTKSVTMSYKIQVVVANCFRKITIPHPPPHPNEGMGAWQEGGGG